MDGPVHKRKLNVGGIHFDMSHGFKNTEIGYKNTEISILNESATTWRHCMF